jgi:REP element-mobilizing transposase RayT
MHYQPADIPLAYFLTLRTDGTWLHGDDRGSVDARHHQFQSPLVAPDVERFNASRDRMQYPRYLLAADSAALVEKTIAEVCTHRGWKPHVIKARTNHVHTVVHAPVSPERAMNDFKAWATRRLRENAFATKDQTIWAEHGSTPYLRTEPQVAGALDYVKNWQGGPLQKTWDEVAREIEEKQRAAKQNP